MTRYEPAIDLDRITAIDVHVHIEVDGHGNASLPPDLTDAASTYFSADGPHPDLDSIAETTVNAGWPRSFSPSSADAARGIPLSSATPGVQRRTTTC